MPSDDSYRSLTDEQWLWLFVNEQLDSDDKLDHMCPKCKSDATSNNCMRCGKSLGGKFGGKSDFVNPNFDSERFSILSEGTDIEPTEEDIDHDLIRQITEAGG